jgi:hypothetical protein
VSCWPAAGGSPSPPVPAAHCVVLHASFASFASCARRSGRSACKGPKAVCEAVTADRKIEKGERGSVLQANQQQQ